VFLFGVVFQIKKKMHINSLFMDNKQQQQQQQQQQASKQEEE
jgi:hypothetical protein